MKTLLCACAFLFLLAPAFSQTSKIKPEKYPSLLWEISGKGMRKPSYLFGTMHVSSKMVFHLSDSFYLAIRNAQVVALETNPGTWQEDFSRYDLDGESLRSGRFAVNYHGDAAPQDYLTINSLKLTSFDKQLEAALYSSPSIINSFLYRSNSEAASDFEEDTYLDLHIFQTGRKLGKKLCGVEDFDGSMQLVKEAYADAAKEKRKSRSEDYDDDFSYAHMEEAYRTGNLDLLDTINKVNSKSAAFDEKFLYRRNEIQAASIDSILRTGANLFVGVGAAHLPGERGVIEALRKKGYHLRPIKMIERDSHRKETIDKLRVPVQFRRQVSEDDFYAVSVPGKLYRFARSNAGIDMKQYTDMVNGSYYIVTRLLTNAAIMGQSVSQVERKLDSVLYENIPGKILSKKRLVKNGYPGYDIVARTRRGDVQRYNIFVTPFEVVIFKMSGNGDYVALGTEATQFFTSIQLKESKPEWKAWSPATGGFEVQLPHEPLQYKGGDWLYAAYEPNSKTAFEIIRTDVHNHGFLEEDSFDLNLMEESFAASECIERDLGRRQLSMGEYPALDAVYRNKDSSLTRARFVIQGPHYYTLLGHAAKDTTTVTRFLQSFSIKPFVYPEKKEERDTVLKFAVHSPVALQKKGKLQLYPEEGFNENDDPDDSLVDNTVYKSRLVENDSTGEKILVSFYKPSSYFFREKAKRKDSAAFHKEWIIRRQKRDTLANGLVSYDYELGSRNSSRMLRGKIIGKEGAGYKIQTEIDTLSALSAFVRSFFQDFQPLDGLEDVDVKKKKAALFFSQFFSSDTLLHKKAVKNINAVSFDSTDLPKLKQSIESLSWKEKQYLPVKKELVAKIATLQNREATAYLKQLYYNAGDTLELQYAALEGLLSQKTAFSYAGFADILQADPPVLNVATDEETNSTRVPVDRYRDGDDEETISNGSFLDNLTDSLQLTAGIFPKLLPLININDYEPPIMALMGQLVDSGVIRPALYEAYLPKFILEAKQALKKQLIREKARAIGKAKKDEEGTNYAEIFDRYDEGFGNDKLILYATLLFPFWEKSPQVQQLAQQLLQSRDQRLRYHTAMLLLRNGQAVPDTLLQQFAQADEYRFELYTDLKNMNREPLFPAFYKTQLAMARGKLSDVHLFTRVDTLVYLEKLPFQDKEKCGLLYFFKYKEKKEEGQWKLATAGLFPKDSLQVTMDNGSRSKDEGDEFTELSTLKLTTEKPLLEQLEALCKKLRYSRRKSAVRFYEEVERYDEFSSREKYR